MEHENHSFICAKTNERFFFCLFKQKQSLSINRLIDDLIYQKLYSLRYLLYMVNVYIFQLKCWKNNFARLCKVIDKFYSQLETVEVLK